MNRAIHYLNTDLDIESPFELAALAHALSTRGVLALTVAQRENATWFATFESDEVFPEPEQAIAALLDVIEALDSESLKLWAVCTLREFNIGYDCGDKPWAFNNGLAANTLARMAALGIGLRVTIYPAVSEETDH